ncbi:hypothetical protein [Bacillus suaedae]|uniref:Uncharacterized protein n=1 Tax=Halalkalibacter suaedae TaxID=2822140 RepID=A0A940WVF5_9BACI|nr:hypothetical protein [Bacillus suaedae]MBP3953135.1 hypothetical protein [Bacillus suaedae]
MKKAFSFVMMTLLLLLTACGYTVKTPTTTSSMLIVVEKGYSSEDEEYWIKAYDPNNQTKEEAFRIIVQDELAWGLIEKNKEYISAYTTEENSPRVLETMEPA